MRLSKNPKMFRELILGDPAFRNLDSEAYNVIVQYTHSNDLLELRENMKKGEKVDMCQALTMMLEEERKVGIKEGRDAGLREGRNAGLREGRNVGLREGKREGKAESILDILSGHSVIPDTLSARILSEKDLSVLSNWLKLAAKSETIEEFTRNM